MERLTWKAAAAVYLLTRVQLFCCPMDCCRGDYPNPGIEPKSSALAGVFFTTGSSGKPQPGKLNQR